MTHRQKVLVRKYGSPREFATAIWRAYADLFITYQEAVDGIARYEAEFLAAGKRKYKQ